MSKSSFVSQSHGLVTNLTGFKNLLGIKTKQMTKPLLKMESHNPKEKFQEALKSLVTEAIKYE